MLPFPQLVQYGNTVEYNYDDINPNIMTGTVTTLGTNSNFGTYGTRMCSYREQIYAITQTSQVFKVDPSTNTFTQIATRPVSVRNIGFTTNGSYLYLAGGYSSTNRFDRYNLNTSTWDTLANLPSAMYDISICIDYDNNDFIYLQKNNLFYKYDIANNTWITTGLATLPFSSGSSAEGGWIYSSGYIYYSYSTNFARYDIKNNVWVTLSSSSMGTRNKISRMGNYIYGVSATSGLWQYQLSTDTWSKINASAPSGTGEIAIACSYNHAYTISGSTLYRID